MSYLLEEIDRICTQECLQAWKEELEEMNSPASLKMFEEIKDPIYTDCWRVKHGYTVR